MFFGHLEHREHPRDGSTRYFPVCYVCQEVYHTRAHYLTEPVDVYHDWIDACKKANQEVEAGDC